jgi:hypothetical protein
MNAYTQREAEVYNLGAQAARNPVLESAAKALDKKAFDEECADDTYMGRKRAEPWRLAAKLVRSMISGDWPRSWLGQ